MRTEYPMIKVKYNLTPELERTSLRDLELSKRSEGVLLRAGMKTVGDIISRWDDLENVRERNAKSGIGVESVKDIHSKVFNWLCENGCVTTLALNTSRLEA